MIFRKLKGKDISDDIVWLSEMMPAFSVRYDSMMQENPLAGERIVEMYAAVQTLDRAIRDYFTKSEASPLMAMLAKYIRHLVYLIELDRNATEEEVTTALTLLLSLTGEMTARIKNNKVA